MSARKSVRAASTLPAIALTLLTACSDGGAGIVEPTPPPPPQVASVSVTPELQSVVMGGQLTLQAQPKAADGTDLHRTVSWSSENESVATVSTQGVVTTIAVGEVGIRATSEGKLGRALITVLPLPRATVAEVRLSVDNDIELEWDGRTQISAIAFDNDGNVLENRQVDWLSNRPSVAAVWSGNIEAVNPGIATITARIEGVVASVSVRVKNAPVVEVFIDAGTTGLEVGEAFVFGSRVKRANGQVANASVQWTSSNPAVARVTNHDLWFGTIEAVSLGTFTLTAAIEGVSTSLTLSVSVRPTYSLIYNRWHNGGSEIFTLDLLTPGASPQKINAGNVSRDASPSPDGTQLVFAVSQTTPTGELQNDLYIVNRNGMNMRWLTRYPGMEDQPQWSPAGNKILFRADIDGRQDLFVINVDGTGLTNLTRSISDAMTDKRDPVWSPDGSRIAFIGAMNSNHKVWTIDANGTNARQITTDAGFDMMPTFSPDGQKIAFVRYNTVNRANGDDIMLVSSQGGTAVRLELAGDQRAPAWSPDGHYIAVSGTALAGQGREQLYTMRPDGSGLRLRTVDAAWGGGVAPAWIVR
ncbi:MAG: Ig-like domain-containing protein [Gemmatimonadota bacterium]